MHWLRRILQAFTALILFLTVWILWPQELDGFTPGRDGKLAVPDYAMTNARYVSVKDGMLQMESHSKDSAYDLDQRALVSKAVTTKFYNAAGLPTVLTADEATFRQEEQKVLLTGRVRSESPDGFVLEGTHAEYGLEKRFLLAPAPIEGRSKDGALHVWANRAESFLDTRKLSLIGDARAQFQEKKRGLTRIRGDRAEVNRDEEIIEFKANVRTEQDKVVGTSNSAEIRYAGRGQEKGVNYMSLLDDVVIRESGGRYTRSQVAEFFGPTDTIVLSGFPSVYNGDDAVTGDRITLYRATGVVEITQTNAAASPSTVQKGVPLTKPRPLTKEDEELIP